jgi:hypothetical protein
MGPPPVPRSPEDVFRDFRARRAGLIRALTTDVEKFYVMCDPGELALPALLWSALLPRFDWDF